MTVIEMLQETLRVMGIGVTGVFIVLALFYFMIKALLRVFAGKPAETPSE